MRAKQQSVDFLSKFKKNETLLKNKIFSFIHTHSLSFFANLKIGPIPPASFTMSDRQAVQEKCDGKFEVIMQHLKTSGEVPEEAKFTFDEIHQFMEGDSEDLGRIILREELLLTGNLTRSLVNELGNTITVSVGPGDDDSSIRCVVAGPHSRREHTWTLDEWRVLTMIANFYVAHVDEIRDNGDDPDEPPPLVDAAEIQDS